MPTSVHGLTPNFSTGVPEIDYEDVRHFYSGLINVYQRHPDWLVLKVFLEEIISAWKERLVFDVVETVDMPTCLPVNTKLYIDSNLDIAVCEKFSDDFRIGSVRDGIDWDKANRLVGKYYVAKLDRCSRCQAVWVCDLCLTAVEYSQNNGRFCAVMNECMPARLYMLFCEMAERGLIE